MVWLGDFAVICLRLTVPSGCAAFDGRCRPSRCPSRASWEGAVAVMQPGRSDTGKAVDGRATHPSPTAFTLIVLFSLEYAVTARSSGFAVIACVRGAVCTRRSCISHSGVTLQPARLTRRTGAPPAFEAFPNRSLLPSTIICRDWDRSIDYPRLRR